MNKSLRGQDAIWYQRRGITICHRRPLGGFFAFLDKMIEGRLMHSSDHDQVLLALTSVSSSAIHIFCDAGITY